MEAAGYRYVCEIAQGGLGRVSLVMRQEGDFRRLYALKRLHSAFSGDRELRDMFQDEARIAGLLRHPNVVSVVDVGKDQEGAYLVMEYVEGVPLSEIIGDARRKGRLIPLQICLDVGKQVALGLHAAHELRNIQGEELQLVHRDVSPSNILVETNGHVRVTDFGIAKATGRRARTSTGVLKGKLGYMAPEMLRFEKPDRRADIFSLGIVLFELVSGERLYEGGEIEHVAQSIIKEPPPDLGDRRRSVPPALVELCFQMLAKRPELRPTTAKEVARRLDAILAGRTEVEGPFDIESWLVKHVNNSELVKRREHAEKVHSGVASVGPVAWPEPVQTSLPGIWSRLRRRPWLVPVGGIVMLALGTIIGRSFGPSHGLASEPQEEFEDLRSPSERAVVTASEPEDESHRQGSTETTEETAAVPSGRPTPEPIAIVVDESQSVPAPRMAKRPPRLRSPSRPPRPTEMVGAVMWGDWPSSRPNSREGQ